MDCDKESSQKESYVELAAEVVYAHLQQYERPGQSEGDQQVDDLAVNEAASILAENLPGPGLSAAVQN